ncbi:MAG: hypothetical protein E3K32_09275 [wastewater metagenome]|nr:hypothetical protein [Candidatus Loosdrechtia aerotolerans]
MNKKIINKKNLALIAFTFLMATAGCAIHRESAKRAPVARAPSLYRVVQPGAQHVRIAPNLSGEYEMLPTNSVLVQVGTDYLTNFDVSIDGETIPLAEDSARQRELDAADKGYYTISLNKDISTADIANWNIQIYPPRGAREGDGFNINIRTVSVNPFHTGAERVSAPLTIPVVPGREGEMRRGERIEEEELRMP